jgi:hypothetical protein
MGETPDDATVNENRLNLADLQQRKYLAQQMENYFFSDDIDRPARLRTAKQRLKENVWALFGRRTRRRGSGKY